MEAGMKKVIVIGLVAALLAAGGYAYYVYAYLPGQATAEEESALQTTTVRRGDLVVTAQGAGTLAPAVEISVGFRAAGVLEELNVAVGDRVEAGQVLGRLDDTEARIKLAEAELTLREAERSLAALTSASAIAAAQLDVVTKRDALNDAQRALDNLLTPDVAYYQDLLTDAQRAYDAARASQALLTTGSKSQLQSVTTAQENVENAYNRWQSMIFWYGADHDRTKAAQESYELAQQDLAAAQLQMDVAAASQQSSVESAQAALAQAQANYDYVRNYQAPSQDVALAQANVAVAQAELSAAEAALAELQGQPLPEGAASTLSAARDQVEKARLALESAQLTVDNTALTAPIAGTVTAVDAIVGQDVGSAAIITLADLDHARIQFYVDETDMGYVDAGYPVSVVFDAAPEVTFSGAVLRVDPALVTVGNAPVVQAWAELDLSGNDAIRLLAGMNADVEVTAGEARNALLVPVQALRELAQDTYAVFVVDADGELLLTPVTVGLMDFTNAEITSGLNQGDVVSTGVVETLQ
jgi:RND family efflux transporter MFP subunit